MQSSEMRSAVDDAFNNQGSLIKILYIFPTVKPGGAEKAAIQIANYLVRTYSFEITFYIFDESDYYSDLIDTRITIRRSSHRFDHSSRSSFWYHYYLRSGYDLFRFIRSERFDCIVGIHEQIPEVIALSARSLLYLDRTKYRPRFVSIIATNLAGLRNERTHITSMVLFSFLEKIRRYTFDRIIVLTQSMKRFLDRTTDHVTIIPNPVELDMLSSFTKVDQPGMPKRDSYVIFVGRVIPQKKHLLLLQAFNMVRDTVSFDVVMIGHIYDPRYEEQLKEYIRQHDLSGRVHIVGAVQQPYQYMVNAKAIILTSNYEGLPMSLLEAMALKIPVIMTRYECHDEYFSDRIALLIDRNSVKELADALLTVEQNDDILFANANRAKDYVNRFDISVIGEMYKRLFSGEVI